MSLALWSELWAWLLLVTNGWMEQTVFPSLQSPGVWCHCAGGQASGPPGQPGGADILRRQVLAVPAGAVRGRHDQPAAPDGPNLHRAGPHRPGFRQAAQGDPRPHPHRRQHRREWVALTTETPPRAVVLTVSLTASTSFPLSFRSR